MYKIPCKSCAVLCDRCYDVKTALCYKCRISKKKEYQRNRWQTVYKNRKIRPPKSLLEKKLQSAERIILARQKKERILLLKRISEHSTELQMKKLGGVKVGRAVKYPKVYFPKKYGTKS